jgi:AraC-like DNA-binding protein
MGRLRTYNPLPARSDCFLQFYLADRYQVVTVATGTVHRAPRCVLVGPHRQRREDLVSQGHLKTFTVSFSAVGFHALFGIPARLICDFAGDASLVLGASVLELESRLAAAKESELPAVAEQFLFTRLTGSGAGWGGGLEASIVREIQARHGSVAIRDVTERYGLSVRQVERTFLETIGLSPKTYARLTRLRLALKLSGDVGEPNWGAIAAASGYFDQSHMVRDFRAFNGATPVQFLGLRRKLSESETRVTEMSHSSYTTRRGQL